MMWLDDEKQCMLLVMRVLSIVPLNHKVRLNAIVGTRPSSLVPVVLVRIHSDRRSLHISFCAYIGSVVRPAAFRFRTYHGFFQIMCAAASLVRTAVTRAARFQLLRQVSHAGASDTSRGNLTQYVPPRGHQEGSRRSAGHCTLTPVPVRCEHRLRHLGKSVFRRPNAYQQPTVRARRKRGGGARGKADGARHLRRDVPWTEEPQGRGGTRIPVLGLRECFSQPKFPDKQVF